MGKDRTMDTYLLIKYLKCATTPEEEARVRAWLADDPDGSHAKQYSDAHFLYEGMLIHGSGSRSFKAEAKTAGPGFRKVILAVASAAAVVLMIAGAGLWSRNVTYDRLSARMETVYVPAGKSMQLTLEDGTELWLNSGTEIEYPAVFSRKSRNVILHGGEVMFDALSGWRHSPLPSPYSAPSSMFRRMQGPGIFPLRFSEVPSGWTTNCRTTNHVFWRRMNWCA